MEPAHGYYICHLLSCLLIYRGLFLKEWKGTGEKTIRTVIVGILIIVASILLVGYGNKLKI